MNPACDANNRIANTPYDPAGNLLLVNANTLTYDAENRQTTVTAPAAFAGGTEQYEVSRHDFAPFGEEIPANQVGRDAHFGPYNDTVNQQFTGKERDFESGLDYFGARYYGSSLGRFTSADEFKGGIVDTFTGQDIETNSALPYADITNPQTLNKYAYVMNNPLRYADPTGHCPFCIAAEEFVASPEGQEVTEWIGSNANKLLTGASAIAGGAIAGLGDGTAYPSYYHGEFDNGITLSKAQGSQSSPEINQQKQAGHVAGTPENKNRLKQGKSTSTFNDAKEGEDLTRDTHATGDIDPKFPNQKIKECDRPIGRGARGGKQSKFRVHEDSKGKIHGHPDGPEY